MYHIINSITELKRKTMESTQYLSNNNNETIIVHQHEHEKWRNKKVAIVHLRIY